MTDFPRLSKPPIQEALIDVRVEARADLVADEFDVLRPNLAHRFPRCEVMRMRHANIQFRADGEPLTVTSPHTDHGRIFKTEDERLLLQCRLDGMTLNQLRPYTKFDELYGVFTECWKFYEAIARPVATTRLALRYINRFEIPSEGTMSDYLTIAPSNGPSDSYISGFVQTTNHGFHTWDGAVNLTTALEASLSGAKPSMIVDVDAYCSGSFDSPAAIDACFAELHEVKNHFFFSAVGPSALDTFR